MRTELNYNHLIIVKRVGFEISEKKGIQVYATCLGKLQQNHHTFYMNFKKRVKAKREFVTRKFFGKSFD